MFYPLPFWGREYPFWFEYDERGEREEGPQIVFITGFRDAATQRGLWRKIMAQQASRVLMASLPQHGRQSAHRYPRGYISMSMMQAYSKSLAREIARACGNRAMYNNHPIILCGHSMGVTALLWTLQYLPKDLLPHVSVMGIAPAFHVDHNVSLWVRHLAHVLRFYPGRIPDEFDFHAVTDASSVHRAIEASTLVYKEYPFLPFLYVASQLGHNAWWYVQRSNIPMCFIHGSDDRISPTPDYSSVQSHCVTHHVYPGRHDPTVQRDQRAQRDVREGIMEALRWCEGEIRAAHALDLAHEQFQKSHWGAFLEKCSRLRVIAGELQSRFPLRT